MHTLKTYLLYIVKGMFMGAADVIPGVSGGTIAFISGIYTKLVESINNINLRSLQYLFTGRWKTLEEQINLRFLLSLVLGVFIAAFSLARLVLYLLIFYEEALWAFFFGLILASVIIVIRYVSYWNVLRTGLFLGGALLAYLLTGASVIQTPDTYLYVFFSGAIAIIAMILPGISGSFILVILDKYRYIIGVVADIGAGIKNMLSALTGGEMELLTYHWQQISLMPFIIFQMGTLTGMLAFSRVLNYLLKKHLDMTIVVLTGFMLGSLNKVWPWKHTLSIYTDRHGREIPLLQENILPLAYDTYFWLCILLAVIGFAVVYYLEKISVRKKLTL